jgi:diaminobutyrate-2-oxoglutarate transaminase
MSVLLIRPELDIWQPAEHNGTFRGNNLAFVTAAQAIRAFWSHERFQHEVAVKGRRIMDSLRRLHEEFPAVCTSIRGRGMMRGVVIQPPRLASAISTSAFERGLIVETSGADGEVLKLLPPLTIGHDDLDRGLEILEGAVRSAAELVPRHRGTGVNP